MLFKECLAEADKVREELLSEASSQGLTGLDTVKHASTIQDKSQKIRKSVTAICSQTSNLFSNQFHALKSDLFAAINASKVTPERRTISSSQSPKGRLIRQNLIASLQSRHIMKQTTTCLQTIYDKVWLHLVLGLRAKLGIEILLGQRTCSVSDQSLSSLSLKTNSSLLHPY